MITRLTEIDLSKEVIAQSKTKDGTSCPIAIAIGKMHPEFTLVWIGFFEMEFYTKPEPILHCLPDFVMPTPEVAQEFIKVFDDLGGWGVESRTFDMPLPVVIGD